MNESMFSMEAAKRQKDQKQKNADNSLQVKQEEKRPGLVRVNVTMSEETRRKLQHLTEKYETTASQLIRSLIIEKYHEE